MTIESNFFSSQGNHKGESFTERGKIGDVLFVLDLGRPWEMQPAEDGSFHFGPQTTAESGTNYFQPYVQSPGSDSPRQFLGFGGALSFCNNQVTYDWQPPSDDSPTQPLSHFASVLVSLDHVAVSGNQFAMHLESPNWSYGDAGRLSSGSPVPPSVSQLLLSDVFVYGGTVEVAQNRLAERVGNTYLSLAAFADLTGIVAYNQCSHYALAYRTGQAVGPTPSGQRTLLIELSNHVMYRGPLQDGAALRAAFKRFGRVSYRLGA